MRVDYNRIKKIFDAKGYRFFEEEMRLNPFGMRIGINSNKFDDIIGVAYINERGDTTLRVWQGTTDPGAYWLTRPMNPQGTFILAPGQHKNCYEVGQHQGKYEALVQVKAVTGYRDNDRDNIIGKMDRKGRIKYESEHMVTGTYGINIHRSNPYTKSYVVDKWSAGCQVFESARDYDFFMDLCNKHVAFNTNKFDYTLFEKSDLYLAA